MLPLSGSHTLSLGQSDNRAGKDEEGWSNLLELLLPPHRHARCLSFGLIPPHTHQSEEVRTITSIAEMRKLMSFLTEAFHESPQQVSQSRFTQWGIRPAHFTDPPELPAEIQFSFKYLENPHIPQQLEDDWGRIQQEVELALGSAVDRLCLDRDGPRRSLGG